MSKLLALKITDDELRSSQPPKPPPNLWEQFLPDSITDITSPASINLQVKSEDPLQSAIPGVPDVNLSTVNQQNEPLQEVGCFKSCCYPDYPGYPIYILIS